jgi:DNA-binding IclR family transcriptional regulator
MRNSLEKIFSVMEAIAECEGTISLKALSETTRINSSTLSRILSNLQEAGYVQKENYREFSPGLGMVALGQQALKSSQLPYKINAMVHSKCLELNVDGAVSGLHRHSMVYFYHSAYMRDPQKTQLSFTYPLYQSNAGLTILAVSHSEDDILKIMNANLTKYKIKGRELADRMKYFRKVIPHIKQEGYSIKENLDGGWNISFPFKYGKQILALSFFPIDNTGKMDNPDKMIKEAALLTRKITMNLSGESL